jgi:phytanoyl-CoA hydroxylase
MANIKPAEQFTRDGFVVLRQLAEPDTWRGIRQHALDWLEAPQAPVEYESDLGYPGAPNARDAIGGATPRRLLQAWQRHRDLQAWSSHPRLVAALKQLMPGPIWLPLAHHNCLMCKHPQFSSDSGWHQDLRYWSYQRGELITAWLALGDERPDNGGLMVIPGSHRHRFETGAFDQKQFFRTDHESNQSWLERAQPVTLDAGDVLLFHCKLLHAASRNHGIQTKLAAVFTYRSGDDHPIPGSRSAKGGDVLIAS